MKYLMLVLFYYLNIVLPLLGYEISNVGIFKYCFTIIGLLFYYYWVMKYLMSVYLNIVLLLLGYEISNVNIVLPLLGYDISNVGIFKYCFTITGL